MFARFSRWTQVDFERLQSEHWTKISSHAHIDVQSTHSVVSDIVEPTAGIQVKAGSLIGNIHSCCWSNGTKSLLSGLWQKAYTRDDVSTLANLTKVYKNRHCWGMRRKNTRTTFMELAVFVRVSLAIPAPEDEAGKSLLPEYHLNSSMLS